MPEPIVSDEEIIALRQEAGRIPLQGPFRETLVFARRLLTLQAERLAEMLEHADLHPLGKLSAGQEAARLIRERAK